MNLIMRSLFIAAQIRKGCVLENHIRISCLVFVCVVFVVSQISHKIQCLTFVNVIKATDVNVVLRNDTLSIPFY